ncbi:hypothetical protein EZ449_12225 [Pedobacter frigidisoli]|uniref:Uncharacterized protein n=1 Tax=Pedobacter frigidisoli TaxID=2530455 RepID=A0A4R0P084_9SPHI|nr:hypothetical protein [Pedobacter frigidisoli]TCD08599.1 hypothetical protein EZ449_12225 [Pedobacter frigidisoli]
MGTTQRIVPGVTGQPNWGPLNNAITRIAKTVEEENKEDGEVEVDEEQHEVTPEEAEKYRRLVNRRKGNLKSSLNNLVRTGGGSSNISKGGSASMGRAGRATASKFTSVFYDIRNKGLDQTLTDLGFNLEGKSYESVMDFLLIYCSSGDAGMDETAANKAFSELTEIIASETGGDLDLFEDYIAQIVDSEGLSDILCTFWGLYVFEHLSQRFQEKITQAKGETISKETFRIIKEDILAQVNLLDADKKISNIDWRGAEGSNAIESIFESILIIISDGN